jgi:hypothetical protein
MVTFSVPGAGPEPRLVIPSPAGMARMSGLRPRRVPPVLGPDRHPDAEYWLDTCVGLSFVHVGRLDLLRAHYGPALVVVQDVHSEADLLAHRNVTPLARGASDEERASRQKRLRVRDAARALCAPAGLRTLGAPVELPLSQAEQVRKYRNDLAALPEAEPAPAQNDAWSHLGESAIVCAFELRRAATGPAATPGAMLSNDGKARLLGKQHGMAGRTVVDVLREMARDQLNAMTAASAWDLYSLMTQVSDLPLRDRPRGPQNFG